MADDVSFIGVDGSVKGWNEEFLSQIGLQELCKNDFERLGGVDKVVKPTTHLLLTALPC